MHSRAITGCGGTTGPPFGIGRVQRPNERALSRVRLLPFTLTSSSPISLSTDMERFPTEILMDILFRSCVSDGGRTAASLSATCQHIRELIAPFRYDTVVLAGFRAVRAFTYNVDARGGESLPVTRLFVSGMRPTSSAVAAAQIGSAAHDVESRAQLSASGLDTLLGKLSPTLRHLASLPSLHDPVEFLLVPTIFPFLSELTIGTSCLSFEYTERIVRSIAFRGTAPVRNELVFRLPSLRRLHFTQPVSDIFALAIPSHVTHLRFSNARPNLDALELVRLLWSRGVLRETLESVVLQPVRLPEVGVSTAELLSDDVGYAECVAIVRNGDHFYERQQALMDWLDRTRGGLGCWRIPLDAIRRPVRTHSDDA
jgi:hypothetical protein